MTLGDMTQDSMAGEIQDIKRGDLFKEWVGSLKADIRRAQIKANVKVNSELLHLYWHLGAEICEKQKAASLGDGFLRALSEELMAESPTMKGFSYRNLRCIRQWYSFYNQQGTNWQQLVANLGEEFFSVPWGHHLYILSQCKDIGKAVFYLRKTVENTRSHQPAHWHLRIYALPLAAHRHPEPIALY